MNLTPFLIAVLLLAPAPALAQAGPGDSQPEAIPQVGLDLPGRFLLQLRPRYYHTEQSNKPRHAEAFNMRTLAGYRTGPIADFDFTGQLVNVSWHNPIRANDQPGNPGSPYPLIGDPDTTDMNLLFGDYTGFPATRVRLGRQAIKLDNERFVGDADVRQMPQVFDAISVRNTSLPNTELFFAHAWHVRTFFGNRFSTDTTLVNARTQLAWGSTAGPSVGAYGYFQNQAQVNGGAGLPDNSNRIIGARLEGDQPLAQDLSLYYTAEAAVQRPYHGGSPLIRASYERLAIGPTWKNFSAQLNYERLGSNGGLYGFQTPLTFNTFNGWAYEFFSTPATGVRDVSASVTGTFGRLKLWAKYHEFKPDFGGGKYGDEWDFAFAWRVNNSISVEGVYGNFRRDASFFRPDAERYYVTLKYEY